MSSRVQKGGTLFKPIAKSRSRTAPIQSRQPSTALEPIQDEPEPSPDPAPIPQPVHRPPLAPPSPELRSEISQPTAPPTQPQDVSSEANASQLDGLSFTPRASAPPQLISSTPRPSVPVPIQPISRLTTGPPTTNIGPPTAPSATPIPLPSTNATSVPLPPRVASAVPIVASNLPPRPSRTPASPTPQLTPDPDSRNSQTPDQNPGSEPDRPRQRGKKRKKNDATPETDNGSQCSDASSKRSKKGATAGRSRKRAPSPPPYDVNADPGEDIDPTTVTMASLCVDTGQGRVSSKAAEILSNHAAWKLKNREKRARMRAAMEAKKYGRPTEEDLEEMEANGSTSALTQATQASTETHDVVDESGNNFDYTQGLARNQYNVQVRIGPNGETIIDEESLVVDRAEPESTTEGYTHVVESDHTKFVNSGTYGKRYRGSRWSAEETEMFYDALAQYGENYELIAYVLPGRDRKSCKNKFKIEDKKNPARINHCLNNRIPVDIKTLARITGKDFSGPTPVIKAPPPPRPPTPPPEPEPEPPADEDIPASIIKKRSRSQSAPDAGLIIVGNVDEAD